MKPEIKSGIEYGLLTLLVAGLCLWQLISLTQLGEPPAGKVVLLALGMVFAGAMHCVFMMRLAKRTGRSTGLWFVLIVVLMPLGTAMLIASLLSDSDAAGS